MAQTQTVAPVGVHGLTRCALGGLLVDPLGKRKNYDGVGMLLKGIVRPVAINSIAPGHQTPSGVTA